MNVELWSVLFLAFGLGMLHALDADHIIAVSGLSSMNTSTAKNDGYKNNRQSLIFCARWALGHSAALLLIGSAVIFLGMAIPQQLSNMAESLVGVVLILLGVYVLWDMKRQHAHLHFHQHDGMSDHAHWHSHQQDKSMHNKDAHKHAHTPVFVGVLHGVAGSAPLLVLLPVTKISSPWLGFSYLIIFGIGVFLSMVLFGGLLGHIFAWLKQWGNQFINGLRVLVSIISISYGITLTMAVM